MHTVIIKDVLKFCIGCSNVTYVDKKNKTNILNEGENNKIQFFFDNMCMDIKHKLYSLQKLCTVVTDNLKKWT